MLFILNSHIWSLTFFMFLTYSVFIYCLIIYMIPVFSNTQNFTFFNSNTFFVFINWSSISNFILTFFLSFLIINLYWYNYNLSIWFGHLTVFNFNMKIVYLNTLIILLTLYTILTNSFFSSNEIYDFVSTILNTFYWITLLFFINSIFSTIFIIEVLSTIIFLLIITSNYSSTFYYNTLDLSNGVYNQQIFPYTYIQSLLFFFWMSLLASLNLFLFITQLYLNVFTFDWFMLEYIFGYFIISNSFWDIISLTIPWFIFIFSIFLKCGLVPFFFWNPVFFNGLPIHMLFVYICYFYFFFFLFIIHLISSYFSEVYYYYLFVLATILVISVLLLLTILCESYYINIFLAMSSILNSVLVFIALSNAHLQDFVFLL